MSLGAGIYAERQKAGAASFSAEQKPRKKKNKVFVIGSIFSFIKLKPANKMSAGFFVLCDFLGAFWLSGVG